MKHDHGHTADAGAMVCGDRCPKCGLGCNQGTGHGGRHTDREHSW